MPWDEQAYRRLVRGDDRGWRPALLRGVLRGLSVPYGGAAALRNALFDVGLRRPAHLGVPVVSVGNLTTGGTGKTPMVAEITRRLLALGRRPGILSRGYGAGTDGGNDEAAVLKLALPEAPHHQGRDRTSLGRRMLANGHADVLILDDGCQHRQLSRTLEVVLLDATDPWGTALLPRGFRREPLAGLRRADVLVLTRADLVAEAARAAIRRAAAKYAPQAAWAEVAFVPDGWRQRDAAGVFHPAEPPPRPLAACAIGNPEGFRHTLQNAGVAPLGMKAFPDHHRFAADDLATLDAAAELAQAASFAVTEKDAVKLPGEIGGRPVRALRIVPRFLAGETAFQGALVNTLATRGPS